MIIHKILNNRLIMQKLVEHLQVEDVVLLEEAFPFLKSTLMAIYWNKLLNLEVYLSQPEKCNINSIIQRTWKLDGLEKTIDALKIIQTRLKTAGKACMKKFSLTTDTIGQSWLPEKIIDALINCGFEYQHFELFFLNEYAETTDWISPFLQKTSPTSVTIHALYLNHLVPIKFYTNAHNTLQHFSLLGISTLNRPLS